MLREYYKKLGEKKGVSYLDLSIRSRTGFLDPDHLANLSGAKRLTEKILNLCFGDKMKVAIGYHIIDGPWGVAIVSYHQYLKRCLKSGMKLYSI